MSTLEHLQGWWSHHLPGASISTARSWQETQKPSKEKWADVTFASHQFGLEKHDGFRMKAHSNRARNNLVWRSSHGVSLSFRIKHLFTSYPTALLLTNYWEAAESSAACWFDYYLQIFQGLLMGDKFPRGKLAAIRVILSSSIEWIWPLLSHAGVQQRYV